MTDLTTPQPDRDDDAPTPADTEPSIGEAAVAAALSSATEAAASAEETPAEPAAAETSEPVADAPGADTPEPATQAAGEAEKPSLPPVPKVRKESLFIRRSDNDGDVTWHQVINYLGQPPPFARPSGKCAMRVFANDVIAFSVEAISKKNASRHTERPLTMPAGALKRLERRSHEIGPIPEGHVYVEHADDTDASLHRFELDVTDQKVATLDPLDDEGAVELGRGRQLLSLYLPVKAGGRALVIAAGYIGHFGRPGSTETVRRMASMALFDLLRLPEFHLLVGLESVWQPPKPAAPAPGPASTDLEVQFDVPVWLHDDEGRFLDLAGSVRVDVDLHTPSPNPQSRQLLYKAIEPEESLAEAFDPYRDTFVRALSELIVGQIIADGGQEHFETLAYDILLNEVDDRTCTTIREAADVGLGGGLLLQPTMYRVAAKRE